MKISQLSHGVKKIFHRHITHKDLIISLLLRSKLQLDTLRKALFTKNSICFRAF